MNLSEPQFIHKRCLELIRASAMNENHWERTLLDQTHPRIRDFIKNLDDELAIVSFFAADDDWTLYTTHRMVGEHEGIRAEISRDEFCDTDFGDFKGDFDSPRIETAAIRFGKKSRLFYYETGYASMAPIHYFKFWRLKWPVWRQTYQLSKKA